MTEHNTSELNDRWGELSYIVGRDQRYHHKRFSWYSRLDLLVLFVSLFAGSGAFLSLFGADTGWLTGILTLMVTAVNLAAVTFRWSDKARQHRSCELRYLDLSAWIDEHDTATAARLRDAIRRRSAIEHDEPVPLLRALHTMCDNEEAISRGLGLEHQYIIGRWAWLTRYILVHDGKVFPPKASNSLKPKDASGDTGVATATAAA